eukprot:815176-Lingulodinium_polyedra.AAC.1
MESSRRSGTWRSSQMRSLPFRRRSPGVNDCRRRGGMVQPGQAGLRSMYNLPAVAQLGRRREDLLPRAEPRQSA